MVTWSMITELLILTFSPMVVCLPITDFFIETFSPTETLSSNIQSFPTWKIEKEIFIYTLKIQRWSSEKILQFDVLPALSLIKLKLLWKEILNQNIYYIKWLKEEICLEVGSRRAAVRTNKHTNHYYWVIFLSTYTVHVAKPVIYDSMHHMIKRFPTCDLGFIDANGWINGISFAVRDGKSFDIYSKKIEISLNSILKHLQPTIHLTLSTQHITYNYIVAPWATSTHSPRISYNLICQ